MLNTRKNTHRRNKTLRRKRRAGSPSYLKYTFNRWDKKYEAGINMDLSTRKLIKAQKAFANDIVTTLGLKTKNDTYNHFIKSLSTLTDRGRYRILYGSFKPYSTRRYTIYLCE